MAKGSSDRLKLAVIAVALIALAVVLFLALGGSIALSST